MLGGRGSAAAERLFTTSSLSLDFAYRATDYHRNRGTDHRHAGYDRLFILVKLRFDPPLVPVESHRLTVDDPAVERPVSPAASRDTQDPVARPHVVDLVFYDDSLLRAFDRFQPIEQVAQPLPIVGVHLRPCAGS